MNDTNIEPKEEAAAGNTAETIESANTTQEGAPESVESGEASTEGTGAETAEKSAEEASDDSNAPQAA